MKNNEIFEDFYLQPGQVIHSLAQLFLRLALGLSFLFPVLDRLGILGAPGVATVDWGNWENFALYTHGLIPYVDLSTASFFGIIATIGEALFGIMLIIGYKTRLAALGSFALTLIFALSMLFFANYRAPFNYSVFTVSFGSLLLATIPAYKWSIDAWLQKIPAITVRL